MPGPAVGRQYADDLTIPPEDRLLRRIHPTQVVADGQGALRPSTAAFRSRELSVNIETVLTTTGRAPEDTIRKHPTHSLAAITAQSARGARQAVARDPTPEEPAHGVVFGDKTSREVQLALARSASWVVLRAAAG